MDEILFLLGGYDLEMVTIKEVLIKNGYKEVSIKNHLEYSKVYADKKLEWGATLNDYKEFLDYDGKIVAIELETRGTDITGLNLIEIDHHNKNSLKKSSLEQVAELLGVELTRYQQLVAANDRGYIPEMINIGASAKEIEDIRKADRQAQGVTEEDESLAEKSINENISYFNDIIVVKALTGRFSTITDRLFPFNRLIVHIETELVYYGSGISKLIEEFSELIDNQSAFFGGGENGFFGIKESGIAANGGMIKSIQIIANILKNEK